MITLDIYKIILLTLFSFVLFFFFSFLTAAPHLISSLLIDRYGFGDAGKEEHNVPGGATLQYKIKLTAFEKVMV